MKKLVASIFIFALTFFAFSATKVSAAKILTSDKGTVTVAKGEVVNDDVFIGAATAEVDGTINGDVFVGAQTVKVSGTINGNLHIGAQNVMIAGATIKGSLMVGGQTINVDNATVIGGSIFAGGQAVSIDSQVKRNVFVGSGMFTLGDNAKIGKDLYYASNPDASISAKAKISGSVFKSEAKAPQAPKVDQKQMSAFLSTAKVVSTAISFFGSLIIGLILIKLFGKRFAGAVGNISTSFWKSLGVGFLVIIAIVPALIILLITVIGIPLAGLALLVLLIYGALAKIVVGAALGNWISVKVKKNFSPFWAFASGLFLIYLLEFIPIVGGLVGFVVMLLGLGALVLQTSKAE